MSENAPERRADLVLDEGLVERIRHKVRELEQLARAYNAEYQELGECPVLLRDILEALEGK